MGGCSGAGEVSVVAAARATGAGAGGGGRDSNHWHPVRKSSAAASAPNRVADMIIYVLSASLSAVTGPVAARPQDRSQVRRRVMFPWPRRDWPQSLVPV